MSWRPRWRRSPSRRDPGVRTTVGDRVAAPVGDQRSLAVRTDARLRHVGRRAARPAVRRCHRYRWRHIGNSDERTGGIEMTGVVGLSPADGAGGMWMAVGVGPPRGARGGPAVSRGAMLARSADQRLVVTAVVPEP